MPFSTTRKRQQKSPLLCSIRNIWVDVAPFVLGIQPFENLGLTRTMLPGIRSGKARASWRPILAYKKPLLLISERKRSRLGLTSCRSCARGAIGGTRPPRARFRNQGIHASSSTREESSSIVRFEGRRTGNVFEVTSQHAQPIREPVAGDLAECKHLMKAWTEGSQPELMVKSVGKEVGRRTTESRRR